MEQDGFVNYTALLHCAVYALLKRGVVVYVGQSRTPFKRLYSHATVRGRPLSSVSPYASKRKLGFQFDEVWLRPCALTEVDDLERELIQKYRPKNNTAYSGRIPEELKTLVADIIQSGVIPPSRPTLNIRRRV
jgi:hypothetical protein